MDAILKDNEQLQENLEELAKKYTFKE